MIKLRPGNGVLPLTALAFTLLACGMHPGTIGTPDGGSSGGAGRMGGAGSSGAAGRASGAAGTTGGAGSVGSTGAAGVTAAAGTTGRDGGAAGGAADARPEGGDAAAPPSGFEGVMTELLFNQMFPDRNQFYTFQALVAASRTFPTFANAADITTRKREVAAFLANAAHETGGLSAIEEINKNVYCAAQASCACAGGKSYFGRGPLQLTWNYNYCTVGTSLGLPLEADPDLVGRDVNVAWRTSLWFWMFSTGGGSMTGHNAMVNGAGFGETIRTLNGSLECNGGNPQQVQSRVNYYMKFTQLLGVTPGSNTSC